MTAGIVDTLLLLSAVILASLSGRAFGFASGGLRFGSRSHDRAARFGFASFAALVPYLGAATLLALAFKWWVPVAVLLFGPLATFAAARRGGRMQFARTGKIWWLTGFFLLATVAAHAGYRLWWNPDAGSEFCCY